MPRLNPLKNRERFHRLTFIGKQKKVGRTHFALFSCDCGSKCWANPSKVRSGHTQSCGCYQRQRTIDANRKHGNSSRNRKSDEYLIWMNMKTRCYNERYQLFHCYGGRGIRVCKKWKSDFRSFLTYVGKRPSKNHSIDRINNNGNYEPGNVRWATRKQQSRNRRCVLKITIKGVTRPLPRWSAISGIKCRTIWRRLKDGWSNHDAVFMKKMTTISYEKRKCP